ncbi:MAG: hypothetical protein AAF709_21745, partial [Pseudomonadota bacterium]
LSYYRAENPGVLEPPEDGWHYTGDIVSFDAQGFITIRGRAKCFAEILGEMISLSAVEAIAAELSPSDLSVIVAMPDQRKGERLVLLTSDTTTMRQKFQALAKSSGATELMVQADVFHVGRVTVLGSGKPDYVKATELVREMAAKAAAA